jgi:hypothetical protein
MANLKIDPASTDQLKCGTREDRKHLGFSFNDFCFPEFLVSIRQFSDDSFSFVLIFP